MALPTSQMLSFIETALFYGIVVLLYFDKIKYFENGETCVACILGVCVRVLEVCFTFGMHARCVLLTHNVCFSPSCSNQLNYRDFIVIFCGVLVTCVCRTIDQLCEG